MANIVSSNNIEISNPDIIQPININTVHRICSGQVVLSLAIAVKELVENAIDASATNIEVRLKDYGSELLEVSDNGNGVREENFQALTLKHYTSKLREFIDLESVETLGFRGEALSSLCALSTLTIVTKHSSAQHATKIQYDANGKIIKLAPAARDRGTSVILENLFSTLPVRRKEFTKNLKREYSKMCQLLYAYCLVSKGIKFTCSNQTNSGSRSTVVSTEGSSSTRDNIISVFGPRQVPTLKEIEMTEPIEQILEEFKLKLVPGEPIPFKFECFMSNATHGSGRSTTDRQFFYINSRPCEPNKIIKTVNDVYKQFNGNQYPFVFLNVEIERSLIDVNVTPDKRQVFLEKEKLLLAVLKSSLLEAFKNCPSTFTVQNFSGRQESMRGRKRPLELTSYKSEQHVGKNKTLSELYQRRVKSDSSLSKNTTQSSLIGNDNFNISILDVDKTPEERLDELISCGNDLVEETDDSFCFEPSHASTQLTKEISPSRKQHSENAGTVEEETFVHLAVITENVEEGPSGMTSRKEASLLQEEISVECRLKRRLSKNPIKAENTVKYESSSYKTDVNRRKPETIEDKLVKKSVTVRSSLKYLKDAMKACERNEKGKMVKVCFRSEITNNKQAQEELERQITKDMFKKMQIIGQFNLGFIITKLENDLFIIDQHATDEKYNFEQLQLTTVLDSQVLVNPKPIELTAANEEVLMENEEVFRKNGFKFIIDSNAPATKKVALTSIPISKNFIFGKDDIEEMLFMLQEDVNHAVCRPSRVQAMFASRACRKSIMIGYPLGQNDMRRLVDHMGEIEQPWNCPHGRPTMRHLINLKLIQHNR